ncbi:cyclase family protein [Brachybacterium halotolerans subsp. kimchii]|uniref:cyclase family protein n=1 Tax=Brachybacterium halotolerans TaxID=2795215 RepID=UPI001E37B5C9|nr:cyclase family protein [Brachybacterium halotolerans]UEJ81811.1 cyclase family protein [Brachybacterium halotolerans subsp. kimchii]
MSPNAASAHDDLPSNWGRWGEDDQLGTLNLIDDAARARAAAEVRDGTSVSLARPTSPAPLTTGLSPFGTPSTSPAPVMQTVNFNGFTPVATTDSLLVNTHNVGLTHLDALAHIPVDGCIYPGVPLADAVTPGGVRHGSADPFTRGIITRGVLLDLAPEGTPLTAEDRIGGGDLDAALERQGAEVHAGDAIVVRGNWDLSASMTAPAPGLDLSAVAWLDAHGAAVYVGDIGDAHPPTLPMPMHQVALGRLGMPLVDVARLDDLARTCADLQRWSFMLVLAPPRILGTTGLAVNPIAVF